MKKNTLILYPAWRDTLFTPKLHFCLKINPRRFHFFLETTNIKNSNDRTWKQRVRKREHGFSFLLIKKIQALPLAKRPQTQKGIRKSFCLSRILTWKCGESGTVMPPALINRVTVTSCRCSVYQLYVLRAKFATENNFDDSTVHDMICREPFLCPKVIHLYLIMNWNKKNRRN